MAVWFFLQATASIAPQLWQPPSGIIMTNDSSETNPEDAVSCFALSKNDSYVMSASGGKISLFNMMTFKVIFHPFSHCFTPTLRLYALLLNILVLEVLRSARTFKLLPYKLTNHVDLTLPEPGSRNTVENGLNSCLFCC